ncbi:hypothetical protein QUE94_08435 [Lactococcus lactis]|uniref:hypothetical protein n=1 Tax=Lactococcus lactis TaxID=1358 RepID=UPI0025A2151E|nr:hypothetical protein [Lactococcus lactis]MDM7502765.1 hypothetical protein [Lactococcus lactis]MDM7521806.1 hypothetical protein [Lactococcus lactis]
MNDDTLINLVAHGLVDKVISLFNEYLGTQLKIRNKKRVLPYISKKRVMEDLDISDGTLDNWEKQGLNRYKPKYKTSLIYYLIDDICKFIIIDT